MKLTAWIGEQEARPRYRAWCVLRRSGWDRMVKGARVDCCGKEALGIGKDEAYALARMEMGLD